MQSTSLQSFQLKSLTVQPLSQRSNVIFPEVMMAQSTNRGGRSRILEADTQSSSKAENGIGQNVQSSSNANKQLLMVGMYQHSPYIKQDNLEYASRTSEIQCTSSSSRHLKLMKHNNFFANKDTQKNSVEPQNEVQKKMKQRKENQSENRSDQEDSAHQINVTTQWVQSTEQNYKNKEMQATKKNTQQNEYYSSNFQQLEQLLTQQKSVLNSSLASQKKEQQLQKEESEKQKNEKESTSQLGQFVTKISRGQEFLGMNKKQSGSTSQQQMNIQKLLSPYQLKKDDSMRTSKYLLLSKYSKNDLTITKNNDPFNDTTKNSSDQQNSIFQGTKSSKSQSNNNSRFPTPIYPLKNLNNSKNKFQKYSTLTNTLYDENDKSSINKIENNNLKETSFDDIKMKSEQILRLPSPLKSKTNAYYNSSMRRALSKRPFQKLSYFDTLFKEHFIQSFGSLKYCKQLKPISKNILNQKKVQLEIHPHNQGLLVLKFLSQKNQNFLGKKTIVFDLDETLIHCNESTIIPHDAIISVKCPNNGAIEKAGINIRPYAKECLAELSKYFEIIIFTASHECYASQVIQLLDPEQSYVSHQLYRDSCIQSSEGIHLKDLRIFENRNIQDIVLVDNAAYSFGMQIENGIPIIPFYNNKFDTELQQLQEFLLTSILNSNDVREEVRKHFKMHLHQANERMEQIQKRIYN